MKGAEKKFLNAGEIVQLSGHTEKYVPLGEEWL